MAVQSNNKPAVDIRGLYRLAKTAQHYTDPASQANAKLNAARQLLQLLGVGAAGGIGVRSLMGLRDMMTDTQLPMSASGNLPRTISVFGKPQHPDVAALPPPPEKKRLGLQKLAGLGQMLQDGAQGISDSVGHFANETLPKAMTHVMPDTHTLNPLLSQYNIPAGMLAMGGGALGGYKLLDWLLHKEKAMAGTNDVDSAKDEYHQALAEQYRAAMLSKKAGDDLGVNELADRYAAHVAEHGPGQVKEAIFGMSAIGAMFPWVDETYRAMPGMGYDNWDALKGGANAASLATLLGTGKLTYDWAKGQNKQDLLRKALRQRQMLRQQMSPPPIVALTDEDPLHNAA